MNTSKPADYSQQSGELSSLDSPTIVQNKVATFLRIRSSQGLDVFPHRLLVVLEDELLPFQLSILS